MVLAYLERRKKDIKKFSPWETVFPDELTKTPPRFAIAKRNRIMLRLADTAVVYVEGPGGAADFKRLAEACGKRVINLAPRCASCDYSTFFNIIPKGSSARVVFSER